MCRESRVQRIIVLAGGGDGEGGDDEGRTVNEDSSKSSVGLCIVKEAG